MAERTSVLQTFQVGVEATPGTAVAANRHLPSWQVTTSIEGDTQQIMGSGSKFPIGYAPGKEWTGYKISAQPTYDELVYMLMSAMSYAAPVQQAATTAYKWTQALSSTTEDTIKTYTFEQGSAVRAHKAAYGVITEFGLKGDRSKVEMSGAAIGQRITDNITLTATPTEIPQVPIMPAEIAIYADDTSAGLGTTKFSRLLSWELTMKNRFGAMWVVDPSQTSWVAPIEKPIDCQLKLLLAADANGMAPLTTLRAGAKKFIRITATSPTLAGTAIPYSFQFDMCGEIKAPSKDFKDSDGVYAAEWTFGAVHDTTWGKAVVAQTINKLTTA